MKIKDEHNSAFEPITTNELDSVTGGFSSASSLLQYLRNAEKQVGVLRPPPPPNLEGSLTGDFRRDLGTWPRFANPGLAGTGAVRSPLISPLR